MSSFQVRIPSGIRWSGQLVAILLVCALALGVILYQGAPILLAAVRPSPNTKQVDATTALLVQHQDVSTRNRERLEGRYLFFPPTAWKRKAPPPPPPPPPAPPAPPPPPPAPPAEYTGPKPVGIFGTTVYFEDGRNRDLGKEVDGVKVVEIVSNWELKVQHKTKVYTVTFGQKPDASLFQPPSAISSVPGMSIVPASAVNGDRNTERGSAQPAGGRSAPSEPSEGAAGDGKPATPLPNLDQRQIQRMSPEDARVALAAISDAISAGGHDQATQERLEQMANWLQERLAER